MSTVGVAAEVRLKDGTTVTGWMYYKGLAGLFLALDRSGKDIRYLPTGTWSAYSYNHNDRAEFQSPFFTPFEAFAPERLNADQGLYGEIIAALNQTDFNRTRRILLTFEELLVEYSSDAMRTEGDVAELSITTWVTYREFLDELDRSGLAGILLERSDEIQRLVREQRIPHFDQVWARDHLHHLAGELTVEDMVMFAANDNLLREYMLGRRLLVEISIGRLSRDPDINPAVEVSPPPAEAQTESRLPNRLKKIAAMGKMAAGGGLAAANVCAGVTIGIASLLPTLSIGTIAGAVGIATSTYTGLNAACDALRDLAETLD